MYSPLRYSVVKTRKHPLKNKIMHFDFVQKRQNSTEIKNPKIGKWVLHVN